MTPQAFIAVLGAVAAFMVACAAVAWAGLERRERRRLETRLTRLEAQLHTYRQWTGNHLHLAFPDPSDQEGGTDHGQL